MCLLNGASLSMVHFQCGIVELFFVSMRFPLLTHHAASHFSGRAILANQCTNDCNNQTWPDTVSLQSH